VRQTNAPVNSINAAAKKLATVHDPVPARAYVRTGTPNFQHFLLQVFRNFWATCI
jgi:hypothetical protein